MVRQAWCVRSFAARSALALMAAVAPVSTALADLIVPSGGLYTTNPGLTDLACTDVVVGGTLTVDSGSLVNVRHLTIQAGGTINGGSGAIQLGGNWTNAGTFTAGTSTVRFNDLCGLASATISGSTTFANARFLSTTGKNYVFAVGTTQTVGGILEIAGTASSAIQFRSGTPGQLAYINLLPAGTQQIQHVGVTDVWATGQHLAPSLSNQGGGGNANRWFGGVGPNPNAVAVIPVPALGDLATLALAALLALFGIVNLRRRGPSRARSTASHRSPRRDLP